MKTVPQKKAKRFSCRPFSVKESASGIKNLALLHAFMAKIFLLLLFISCKENKTSHRTLAATNPCLQFKSGVLLYNNNPFTGTTEEKYTTGVLKTTAEYLNGKEQGFTKAFYEDGEKESARYYTDGHKDSTATGWYPGGAKKFEYHFKDDLYNGAFTEWYPGGQTSQQIMYANGKEISGQGRRENGKLYMNFIWKGNRRYGLVNPNMCYGVAKGEVVD